MFTTINIYETILNKYYVHHILKIFIYTGITATTKFVLCHTRQHLNLPVVTSSLDLNGKGGRCTGLVMLEERLSRRQFGPLEVCVQ